MTTWKLVALTVVFAGIAGCGHTRYLVGTTIPATEDNLAIVETIEQ